jgi:hypothetical protein
LRAAAACQRGFGAQKGCGRQVVGERGGGERDEAGGTQGQQARRAQLPCSCSTRAAGQVLQRAGYEGAGLQRRRGCLGARRWRAGALALDAPGRRAASSCLWLHRLGDLAKHVTSRNQLVTVSHSRIFELGPRNRSSVCAAVAAVEPDMFHDLNIPWTDATRELQRTVVFLDECECNARISSAQWLTQCSRIRRSCPHAHVFRKAAL